MRINTTTLLPELMEANLFPGVTFCVESCGGPGCGCFYLRSECLFYRVFTKPESAEIFEIFSCSRWREEVVLHITVTTDKKTTVNETRHLRPTIPVQTPTMKFTLSSLTVPPSPVLHTTFIATGQDVALWYESQLPPLQCTSNRETTTSLKSSLMYRRRLPIRRSWIAFESMANGPYKMLQSAASVSSLSTAELLLTIKEDFDTTEKEVTDTICTIKGFHYPWLLSLVQGRSGNHTVLQRKRVYDGIVTRDDATRRVIQQEAISSLRFSFYTSIDTSAMRDYVWNHQNDVRAHWDSLLDAERYVRQQKGVIAGQSTVYEKFVLARFRTYSGRVHILVEVWNHGRGHCSSSIAIGYVFPWSSGLRIVVPHNSTVVEDDIP
ncbi:hypothetical protein COOONC_08647 [Cooperia oncophora]